METGGYAKPIGYNDFPLEFIARPKCTRAALGGTAKASWRDRLRLSATSRHHGLRDEKVLELCRPTVHNGPTFPQSDSYERVGANRLPTRLGRERQCRYAGRIPLPVLHALRGNIRESVGASHRRESAQVPVRG